MRQRTPRELVMMNQIKSKLKGIECLSGQLVGEIHLIELLDLLTELERTLAAAVVRS